jgi:hypothetical protein
MTIFVEKKRPLFEVVQLAGNREYKELLRQMERDPELTKTLNTPFRNLPKYRYLIDPNSPLIRNATLLMVIKGTMELSGFDSYFVKTPKGVYVGFLAITIEPEDGKPVVRDVKVFSFGMENSVDENQIYKDLPSFLDKCLAKYKKVSWTAMDGNKADRTYAIYTKRHHGTITKNGNQICYVCQEE